MDSDEYDFAVLWLDYHCRAVALLSDAAVSSALINIISRIAPVVERPVTC